MFGANYFVGGCKMDQLINRIYFIPEFIIFKFSVHFIQFGKIVKYIRQLVSAARSNIHLPIRLKVLDDPSTEITGSPGNKNIIQLIQNYKVSGRYSEAGSHILRDHELYSKY